MAPKKRQREGKGQASSPSQFVPWDESPIYFESQAELDRFQSEFENRSICPVRKLGQMFMAHRQAIDLHRAFTRGHWYEFFNAPFNSINITFIRAFYSNLTRNDDDEIYTTINGRHILISEENIQALTGLSLGDDAELPQLDTHNFLSSLGATYHAQGSHFTTQGLGFENRLVLYLITHVLKPRRSSHTTITTEDAQLMHLIIHSTPFNWCRFIRLNMLEAANSNADLPYPLLVMRFLENEGFNLKEGPIQKQTKNWDIDDATFRQTGHQEEVFQRRAAASPKPTMSDLAASLNSLHQKFDTRMDAMDTKIDNLTRRMDDLDASFRSRSSSRTDED